MLSGFKSLKRILSIGMVGRRRMDRKKFEVEESW